MLDVEGAAAERMANGEAMPDGLGLHPVREKKNRRGKRAMATTSRQMRGSLFANSAGEIDSDNFANAYSQLTSRIRSMTWCMRILQNKSERDQEKLEKTGYILDLFLNSLDMWMDDLDEIGALAWKQYMSEGA